jgi:predicted HD phosphohydrolase
MTQGKMVNCTSFRSMTESSKDDWSTIFRASKAHSRLLPERILSHLNLLADVMGAFAIDRLQHSLQTATRAYRAGRDEEYVVCALLHDVGDILLPADHAEFSAAILQPFVSEANYWMLKHHGIFQGYYFFHHIGLNRNMRDAFRGHPYFEYTAQFCHDFDQNSFDPDYDNMPITAFEPMVHRLLAEPKRSLYFESHST